MPPPVSRRDVLRSAYLRLGLGELAAAAVFTVLAAISIMPRLASSGEVVALWCAVVPLVLILVQAAVYWLLARRWVEVAPMPRRTAVLFRTARVVDLAALAAGLVGVVVWWPARWLPAGGFLLVWLFALVEYLNYFVVRLAYPASRWWTLVRQRRTPQLVKDLQAARR